MGREHIEAQLERIALGDRTALAALYDATAAKLFGLCLRVLNDRAEAEDALQEIYVRIWHNAHRYRANGLSPMTWLIAVTRNHCIDRLRARRAAGQGLEVAEKIADPAPGPEASAVAGSERARLAACLDELPAARAEAVQRAYLAGESYADLAARFDVPLNTMRTWLRRSLLRLRECLDR